MLFYERSLILAPPSYIAAVFFPLSCSCITDHFALYNPSLLTFTAVLLLLYYIVIIT